MKKHQLQAEKRKIAGKKVNSLRRQGILPANIYGKKIKSISVQLSLKDFDTLFKEVGETGLVELSVAGEEKPRPVLVHNVQLHPVTSQPLHTDFFQVDLKEKITAMVPLALVGESLAVKDKKGVLLHTLNEIEVEALPQDLPDKLEVDATALSEVDQEIKVGELKTPSGVTLLTDHALVVCKIGPLVTAEMEAELKKEQEASAAAAAESAAARGEIPAQEAAPVSEETPPTEEKSKESPNSQASEKTK